MNTVRTRTPRGAAILFSGVLILGGLALTSEATAGQVVDGNPTCSSLGYAYEYKSDDNPGAATYNVDRDGMTASLTVGTYVDKTEPNPNNAITGYLTDRTDGYAIVVKGGNGAIVYGPGETAPLHAPAVSSDKWPTISHFQLCWNRPTTPEPELGQLNVKKVVLGTDTPEDYTFEICVTPAGGGTTLCDDVVGNGTAKFESLPIGDYVVTETDPGPRWAVQGSGVEVTVEYEDIAITTVTNTWVPPGEELGRVEVTKAVSGTGAPVDGVYEICLEGPDPSTTKVCKTVVGAGTVTFRDLVPGVYKVTETNPGADYAVTITPATVTVTAGGVATGAVTNVYTQQESLPPTVPVTPEVLPPAVPVTPEVPVTPPAAAPATDLAAQAALPNTGSETGIAAIATILVAAGVVLRFLGRRREPQQV